MIIPPIIELSLIGVYDAGIPNRERVIIRPTDTINMASFALLAGFLNENGVTTPLQDYFFYFGEIIVRPPSWIVVFTGPGKNQVTKMPNTDQDTYIFYWGKRNTIFDQPRIVPAIINISSVLIGNPILTTKQIPTSP